MDLVEKTPGSRPKRMNANILISNMEDIYTARFLKDTSYFKAQLKRGNGEEISDKTFPDFIYAFYKRKHKNNKKNIQQSCQDLICSLEHHRKEIQEADLFSNFLTQVYDTRDLVFFLYTRWLLEKEMGIKFSCYGKVSPSPITDPRSLLLSMKVWRKIASIFFEEDENELNNFLNSVQDKIDENYEVSGDKKIHCTSFLLLLLTEFHASKNSAHMQKSLENIENPFDEEIEQKQYRKEETKGKKTKKKQGEYERVTCRIATKRPSGVAWPNIFTRYACGCANI